MEVCFVKLKSENFLKEENLVNVQIILVTLIENNVSFQNNQISEKFKMFKKTRSSRSVEEEPSIKAPDSNQNLKAENREYLCYANGEFGLFLALSSKALYQNERKIIKKAEIISIFKFPFFKTLSKSCLFCNHN